LIRFLSVDEVKHIHARLIEISGGSAGLRDEAGLDSAVNQPRASFGGEDLYPSIIEKAAALAYSLVNNHAFVDGNKRIGHAAMEVFLLLNGFEISADVDEQERVFLGLAAGSVGRDELNVWLSAHTVARSA
jgi:death-on-curing protein